MDNKFTRFLDTYADDIKAFIEAFKGFITALIEKLTAAPDEEVTE